MAGFLKDFRYNHVHTKKKVVALKHLEKWARIQPIIGGEQKLGQSVVGGLCGLGVGSKSQLDTYHGTKKGVLYKSAGPERI